MSTIKKNKSKRLYSTLLLANLLCSTPLAASNKTLPLTYVKTPDWSLSESFLCSIIDLFGVDTFVESGTFLGNTAARAARHFRQVHTIELSPALHEKASQRFSNTQHVHVHLGDSAQVLLRILPTIHGKILFWLDGHYSEGVTAKGEKNTPVVQELEAIAACGFDNAVIMIDDIRCFQKVDDRPENRSIQGYPSVEKLEHLIYQISPNYEFKILGDTAIAYPKSDGVTDADILDACTTSRLAETKDIPREAVLNAQEKIAQATQEEQNVLKRLYDAFKPFARRNGLAKHYFLWYGLSLGQKGRPLLLRAHKLGIPYWQIEPYVEQ